MIPLTMFSFMLLAAHALRADGPGAALFWILATFLPLARPSWRHPAMAGLLLYGVVLWSEVTLQLVGHRIALDLPWHRLAVILVAVTLLTLGGALMQGWRSLQRQEGQMASGLTFLLVVVVLVLVREKGPMGIILLDRFFPGGGWPIIFLLGVYGAWLVGKMMGDQGGRWRRLAWGLFSGVFFLQLGLGLLGLPDFLMTGKLHLPIPALIAAGPLYRGEGFFMVILFVATVVLVGPAWCSHLCYIGAWDNWAAQGRQAVREVPGWARLLRWAGAFLVFGTAIALSASGAPPSLAVAVAAFFGVGGLLVMLFWSRRSGYMAHCTVYCPMGLVANLLGKINPWRVVIARGCCQCALCSRNCRYGALTGSDIRDLRAGFSCSLCGDCLSACPHGHLHYRFPGLSKQLARTAFLVAVVTLHAVFLGVARL